MFTFLRVHRTTWRWFRPLVLSITISATLITGISITTAHPARAANASDRGPSAAADSFNNQYVFWKGADSNLWEAFYNSYTQKWNGPIEIKGMGPLGSEPSVAIEYQQVFAGPGGNAFNAQYVYWRGAGTNGTIWMAYWNGSWHGPIALTNTSGPGTPACSQPSATFVATPTGPRAYIFWKGLGVNGTCGSDTDSNSLWYAYSTSFPPVSGADYSGAAYDTYAGVIGSSPSITAVTTECMGNQAACQCYVIIAWQGTNGYLWEEAFDTCSGSVTGPVSDAKALTLGSPPSIASTPLSAGFSDAWDAFWQGSDSKRGLWFVSQFINPTNVNINPQTLSTSGTLGSAPTVAEAWVNNKVNAYVFWKGTDGKLWEAYSNGTAVTWSIISLGTYSGTLG